MSLAGDLESYDFIGLLSQGNSIRAGVNRLGGHIECCLLTVAPTLFELS